MDSSCFICCETSEKLLYKVCKCKSYLHLECFENMINTVPSHNTHCAVCREKYSIKNKLTGCLLTGSYAYVLIFYDVFFVILSGIFLYLVYMLNEKKDEEFMVVAITSSIIFCAFLITWIILRAIHYSMYKRCCYAKPTWKRSVRTFKTTIPKPVYFL